MQDQANPYAPPKAIVGDSVPDETAIRASRGSRLGAAMLDGLIAMIAVLPLMFGIGLDPAAYTSTAALGAASTGAGIIGTALLSLVLIVATIVLVQRNGQTIAKKMLGIKVVRADGSKATLARIFWLRNVVNLLPSMIPVVGNLYSLLDSAAIFGSKQQCLHDRIADTIVVRA